MNLEEALATPTLPEPTPNRRAGDWGFSQEYAPHDHNIRTITATSPEQLETEAQWRAFVETNGGVIAQGYRVRLVEMRFNQNAWTRDATDQKRAITRPSWFYRFIVEPENRTLDISDIIDSIKKARKSNRTVTTGIGAFRQAFGDTQLGKIDGDGTEGIVDQFVKSVDEGVKTFKSLRRIESLGIINLMFLGDCIEGNQSQNGRNWGRTSLTITEQIRVFRRLMKYAIDEYRPLAETIEVDVVNGNHDEVQRFQSTRADDGHATEALISLRDAFELNPEAYGHVKTFIPNLDEAYLTRESGNSIITLTHGHQWRRGKSLDWWKGQSFNLMPAGAANFLFHGHEHEFQIHSRRDRVVFCVPSMESESTWWRHKTGDVGLRGSLILTTNEGTFSNLAVV